MEEGETEEAKQLLEEAREIMQRSLAREDLGASESRVPYQTSRLVEEIRRSGVGGSFVRDGLVDTEESDIVVKNKALCKHIVTLEEEIRYYAERFQFLEREKKQLADEVAILRDDKLVLRAKLDNYDEQAKQLYVCKKALKRLQRENDQLAGEFDKSVDGEEIKRLTAENMRLKAEIEARDAFYGREMLELRQQAGDCPHSNDNIQLVQEMEGEVKQMASRIDRLRQENEELANDSTKLEGEVGRLLNAMQ